MSAPVQALVLAPVQETSMWPECRSLPAPERRLSARGLVAAAPSDTAVLKWRERLICFHCGSRKVDIHLRDRVRPERGAAGLAQLYPTRKLAQLGPVCHPLDRRAGRKRTIKARPVELAAASAVFSGIPSGGHSRARAPLGAARHGRSADDRTPRDIASASPVKAEASFDDLAAKAHPAVGRTVAHLS